MDHVIFSRKANYAVRNASTLSRPLHQLPRMRPCDPAKVLPAVEEAGDKRRHPDGGKAVYFNEKRKLLDIYLLSPDICIYLEGRHLLLPRLQRL